MADSAPEKFTVDVVRLMKIISDAQRKYIEGISNTSDIPDNNATLVAMHALSVMCSLQRGHTKKEMDSVYDLAVKIASKLFAMRQEGVDTQVANMQPNGNYQN
jgi:hypothetical protein